MKKAIGYSRISTKDQSNYSLPGQQDGIIKYCERKEIEVLQFFEEDGQSAKNFDRASWAKLEKFVLNNYKGIDYLLVYKYDRFSRNLTEALAMIDKLENKYKIIVLSVLEDIGVHPSSPMFKYFRTQLLLNADTELAYIKERTKFGMHQGAKVGYFLHSAPFGYINAKDSDKMPTILPHEIKSKLVKEAFRLFTEGRSMADIRKALKPNGFSISGNSAIQRLLSNPAYAGMIKVPSYYDEPEKLIDGKHEPLIDKATWWTAQSLLSGKKNNRQDSEDVPLRGSLHCDCGRFFTAGNSKGKRNYYWYYVCPACRVNYSAIKLHDKFDKILDEFNFKPEEIAFMQEEAIGFISSNMYVNENMIDGKNREVNALQSKIDNLEEKFIEGSIDDLTYRKWKPKFENERFLLLKQIEDLNAPLKDTWSRYEANLDKLADINHVYNSALLPYKKSFISMVFDNKLTYGNGFYRTPYINPVFGLDAALLKEKGLLIIEQSPVFSGETPMCAPDGN